VASSAVARITRPKRDQRVRRVRRQLLVDAPHLDDAKVDLLVASFARVTLLSGDSYEYLRKVGLVNEAGELRSSVDTVSRLIALQLKLARELGLSPATLGKFRNEKPADLAAALAGHVDVEDAEVSGGADDSP
jgi:hypothetical protein